ncbi:MAG: hypothetical protein L0Y45_07630, partial [Woeseiaceae bacterium]|nr:hypothetical protein [Woeseiaceae bacterium]
MANVSYGNVKIGMKEVEIRGFAGKVSGVSKSAYTHTSVDHNSRTSSTSTTNYTEFRLTGDDGSLLQPEVESQYARVVDGDMATALWGATGGKDGNYYPGVYNHKPGELGVIPSERNKLAGPMGVNLMMFIAVFAGVFGVFGFFGGGGILALVVVALVVGFFYWV